MLKGEVGEHVDHCRIGSLETLLRIQEIFVIDHCRIGSLEMYGLA